MKNTSSKNQASKIFSPGKNFTLIELLVVIAIISILMAILLPSLNKVKKMAKNTLCKNNMKQIYLASFNYSTDYNEYLPAAGSYYDSSKPERNLCLNLLPYIGNIKHFQGSPTGTFLCPDCPLVEGAVRYEASYAPTMVYFGYGGNTQGGWLVEEIADGPMLSRKLGQIRNNTVLLTEKEIWKTGWSNYATNYQRTKTGETNSLALGTNNFIWCAPAYRHINTTNFLFKEGNVASYRIRSQIVYDEYVFKAWLIRE
jgi:prepilin-type N-terminal cleavage/methylation domain-containing protein